MIIDPPSYFDTLEAWQEFRAEMLHLLIVQPGLGYAREWITKADEMIADKSR